MKNIFKYCLIGLILLFFTTTAFALSQDVPDVDYGNPNYWVLLLTPLVVLGATSLVHKYLPTIPDVLVLAVVGVISALVSLLNNLLIAPDISWLESFLLGLSATFVHQVYKKITESSA